MSEAPHHQAAFINAINEEGTKAEAVKYLQETWNELCEARARIRELEAARGVAVKPLEWEDFEGNGAKANAFYQASYLITRWRGRNEFEVALSFPGYQTGYDGERFHKTLEAAKAAAQADYERRIRSALSPALVTVQEQEAARVLLQKTPKPVFNTIKPTMLGAFHQTVLGFDENGEEATGRVIISWVVQKQIIRAALSTLAGQGGE